MPLLRHICLFWPFLAVGVATAAAEDEDWRWRCYTPTALVKAGDCYFVVDCWHHRVLWSKELKADVALWHTFDEDLAGPHSLASDGTVYLVEDTGRHAVCVYRRADGRFQRVQRIERLGQRPHRIRYDPQTAAFYVVSADSQDISKLVRDGRQVRLAYTKHLAFLEDHYTRSITIHRGEMYFVSGPRAIIRASYRDDSYRVLQTYKFATTRSELCGMNDIFPTDDGWWYVTATPKRIVRARSLEEIANGRYEDVGGLLGLSGTPYYLSLIDGRYYVPQITEYSGIVSFIHTSGRIGDVRVLWDFGPPTAADRARKARLPL
jgi:hypothetical protein